MGGVDFQSLECHTDEFEIFFPRVMGSYQGSYMEYLHFYIFSFRKITFTQKRLENEENAYDTYFYKTHLRMYKYIHAEAHT